jgi:hypothetical protein
MTAAPPVVVGVVVVGVVSVVACAHAVCCCPVLVTTALPLSTLLPSCSDGYLTPPEM